MQVVLRDVLPERGGDDVPERIRVVVQHHLGLAGGARGEVDQHRVGRPRPLRDRHADLVVRYRRGILEFVQVTRPALPLSVHQEEGVEQRAGVGDLVDLLGVLQVRDDHPELPGLDAVFDIFRGQHRRAGAEDRAEFDERDDEDPPFRDTREHQHHPVALLDAELEEDVRGAVREVPQIAEGVLLLVPLLVDPDHRQFVPVGLGPPVDHVVAEVELLGDVDPEVGAGGLVVGHVRLPGVCGLYPRRNRGLHAFCRRTVEVLRAEVVEPFRPGYTPVFAHPVDRFHEVIVHRDRVSHHAVQVCGAVYHLFDSTRTTVGGSAPFRCTALEYVPRSAPDHCTATFK